MEDRAPGLEVAGLRESASGLPDERAAFDARADGPAQRALRVPDEEGGASWRPLGDAETASREIVPLAVGQEPERGRGAGQEVERAFERPWVVRVRWQERSGTQGPLGGAQREAKRVEGCGDGRG